MAYNNVGPDTGILASTTVANTAATQKSFDSLNDTISGAGNLYLKKRELEDTERRTDLLAKREERLEASDQFQIGIPSADGNTVTMVPLSDATTVLASMETLATLKQKQADMIKYGYAKQTQKSVDGTGLTVPSLQPDADLEALNRMKREGGMSPTLPFEPKTDPLRDALEHDPVRQRQIRTGVLDEELIRDRSRDFGVGAV